MSRAYKMKNLGGTLLRFGRAAICFARHCDSDAVRDPRGITVEGMKQCVSAVRLVGLGLEQDDGNRSKKSHQEETWTRVPGSIAHA